MQDKKIKKIVMETIKYINFEEDIEGKISFMSKMTGGKGTYQVRIKRKIHEEIKNICDEDNINVTEYISNVLGIHLYNLNKKAINLKKEEDLK